MLQIFLALAVIMASAGFTVNRMTCFSSGDTDYAILGADSCCQEHYPPDVVASNCCDFSSSLYQLDHFTGAIKYDPITIPLDLCFIPFLAWNENEWIQLSLSSYFSSDSSPPFYGKSLLYFIHVLTI